MKFLLKLFKALNSAQSPWQVTLAIVLGMVAGLTPLEGIQTPLILLLAFVLNIHLGLFFVASAFFAGIAYLFDPLLEQVGFALLTSDTLEGLWTSWYNSGVMRMTHFNNTLVMGSTAVALALAIPIYLLLGWVITRYRESIAVFINARPWLGKIGIFKVVTKKEPVFRWWGAGVFAVFVALVAAVALLLVDPLLKWALENGASGVLQRDVRIGSVDTHLGEGAVDIHRIEIAGAQEGIDALSMEQMRFDLALNALLLNRTHIEKIAVSGMGFGTKATLKKEAARPEGAEEAAAGTGEGGFELPAFEFPDPKSLLDNADLKSVKVYDEAQSRIGAIRTKWEKVADTEFSADALKALQKEFETIKQHAASKDPQALLKLKDEIAAFTKKIDERKKRLQSLQKEFGADRKRIESLYAEVRKAPRDDYNRLKSAYSLDSSSAMNVIGVLFGEKIKGYLATANSYYARVAPYLKSDKVPEEAVPPRGEGRWIRYAATVPTPELWIAKTQIDGLLRGQRFDAAVNDISDDQRALGRALTFSLESDGEEVKGLKLTGEDNRLGEKVRERLAFSAERIRNDAMAISQLQLSRSDMALKGDLELTDASALGGRADIGFSNAALAMAGLEGELAKALNDALKGVSSFSVGVGLAGSLEEPKVHVESDLDKKLASAAKKAVQGKVAGYEKELKGLLDAQMKEQLGSLQGEAGKIPDIGALVGKQEGALNGLDKQAGGLLGGAGGGAVKGLLPF
jgi:uncharacterized protein (TIGR03545 family)/uncharacterized protein (TIGR03546 family)